MKFCFLLIFLFSMHAKAWNTTDLKNEAASPWTTKARTTLLVGAGLTLTAAILSDTIDVVEDEVVNHKPLGSFSEYGNLAGLMIPNFVYLVGQSGAGLLGNKQGYQRAIGMFKATAYAATITAVLKPTIQEPRPNRNDQRDSFPSAHATNAFSFGGYVWAQHGWTWGIPAIMISSLSGFSRINDNRHRLHDVLAGATIGLGYGLGIGYLQKKESSETAISVIPLFERDIKGLALTKSF